MASNIAKDWLSFFRDGMSGMASSVFFVTISVTRLVTVPTARPGCRRPAIHDRSGMSTSGALLVLMAGPIETRSWLRNKQQPQRRVESQERVTAPTGLVQSQDRTSLVSFKRRRTSPWPTTCGPSRISKRLPSTSSSYETMGSYRAFTVAFVLSAG